jgi:two-component system nitrogen regulation sensor histidine kinase NtrY
MASADYVSSPTPVAKVNLALNQTRKKAARLRQTLRPKVAVRLLLICTFGCLTGYLVFDSPYWLGGLWTGLATAGLFYETVRFVGQSERKLISFLQSIDQNDFSVTFYEKRKSDDYDLHNAFNRLNETYKTLRSEKESQHQLLQVIVETAAVPMICYEEKTEEVYIVNQAAKAIFKTPFLQQISSLRRVDAALPNFIRELLDGEKEMLKLPVYGRQLTLSVVSCHLVFKDRNLKLIAFHDVSSELAMKEADVWQKLLRVLTHEISNSAIPLSTLSSFIHDMIRNVEGQVNILSDEDRSDLMTSLKTIEQRSKSLKEFVHNFRNVNNIPEPAVQKMSARLMVDEIRSLFSREAQKENVTLELSEPDDYYTILADKNLTMQVMINVVKNAIEAMSNMKENKVIKISFEKVGRYINVHIVDNGCGIAEEDVDQIFIPFFTTKKGGSGIGLSISRQIMQKQRGDIQMQSVAGRGTDFILSFQQG